MIYVSYFHWQGLFHWRPLWFPETMFLTRFSSFPVWRVTMSVWQPWTCSSNVLTLSSALTTVSFSFVTCVICFLCVLFNQSCPILCDPIDCSLPGSSPLFMGFSKQEYWSGLPFSSPGDLPDPGIEPESPALQADSLPFEPPGKPMFSIFCTFRDWFKNSRLAPPPPCVH